MSLHTFLITMNEERKRHTIDELKKVNIKPEIISGVDGSTNRNNNHLTSFCKTMCTDRIIGCALAHRNVMEKLVKDELDYALVVEDDIIIENPTTFDDDINKVLNEYEDKEWDFISLFCQGICLENSSNRFLNGSTAAYLISNRGAQKMLNGKIAYHADIIRQNLSMNSFLGPQLFSTLDPRNGILLGNQEIKFWLNQDAIQVGKFRAQFVHFISLWLVIICTMLALKNRISSHTQLNIYSLLLTFPFLIMYYMTHETQHYRCSKTTQIFNLLFPTFILLGQRYISDNSLKHVLVPSAYGMLIFHLLHGTDK